LFVRVKYKFVVGRLSTTDCGNVDMKNYVENSTWNWIYGKK